jgi:hypothetical protein
MKRSTLCGAVRGQFIVFAGKLLVVVVSEALAYFALCHSTVIFVVDGAGMR